MEFFNIALAFFCAFMVSFISIPFIIDFAHSQHLLDPPKKRGSHQLLTPRLGGIAIFLSIILGFAIFVDFDNNIQILLASMVLLFIIGIRDDLTGLSVGKKLLVQILVAALLILVGDLRITSLYGFLYINQLSYPASAIITLFFIVGLTNAINLIDGIDGLAGVIISIICLSLGILFFQGNTNYAAITFILLGAILGFLPYNFKKAKVFMGDTGALVAGILITFLSIKFLEISPIPGKLPLLTAILIIPVLDTVRVMILRISKGRSPFKADKNHIHHVLIRKGLNSVMVVSTLAICNIIVIVFIWMLGQQPINTTMTLLIAGLVAAGIVIELISRKRFNDHQV